MTKLSSLICLAATAAAFCLAALAAPDASPDAAESAVAVEVSPSAPAAPSVADEEISVAQEWAGYVRQGGLTMVFIGLLSVLGFGCAIERLVNLRRGRIVPDGFSAKVIELWKDGRVDEVAAYCAASKSMLARVVETMLQHRESDDYAEVKLFAEDKAGRELRLENRKAAMLSTAATLAPLLGLFGTVFGLLGAFQTVARMGEMGNAAVLADDIGKALITTVGGLAVSMPCLFLFGIVKNRLNLYAVLLEEEIADLVNQIFVRKR